MAGKYKVEVTFMPHQEGTKFYEVATITSDEGSSISVRRYGPVKNAERGGTVISTAFGTRACARSESSKFIVAKTKRGYNIQPTPLSSPLADGSYTESSLQHAIRSHYSTVDAAELLNKLSIKIVGDSFDYAIFDECEEMLGKKAEPKPEPVRGEEWASW